MMALKLMYITNRPDIALLFTVVFMRRPYRSSFSFGIMH